METSTLLIRHLPSELTATEKDDLLRHFGAISVRLMGTSGPMKHTAFAEFPDQVQASKALTRLHQLDVLGSRLKVEFAKQSLAPDRTKSEQPWTNQSEDGENSSLERKEAAVLLLPSDDNVYHKWSINYPRNPRLHYLYPPPTVSILTNIANALASYPKFYVQVLHLMNKMNLPAPFGALTTTPPIPADLKDKHKTGDAAARSSSSESEIESEGEEKSLNVHVPDQIYARKRKRSHKKAKLMIQPPADVLSQGTLPPEHVLKPEEVFEKVQEKASQKKIQLKLPSAVSSAEIENTQLSITDMEPTPTEDQPGGFGRIEPVQMESSEEVPKDDDDWLEHGVISLDELDKGRLPKSDLKELSVFRKYDRGEPSCRLYLKNVARQVTERDLRFLYGCFIDVTNSLDLNIFDVRVMKEGRMKGQAFVTLPSEEKAIAALEHTNGYIINGKPLVVQFARSAKQK